ncbi:MAG: c-type cytochrome [Henriciella sp.]
MGELGLNKVFGAILAVALVILGLREVSSIVFGGGHHGEHHYASVNEWAAESFAYRVEMTENSSAEVVEEVYDLGLLMAGADISAGERSFKGKCATCHSIDQDGVNGTGPNLFAIVGAAKGAKDGFSYSGALTVTEGDWSYENLDLWLEAPSRYARGTSMAFAGLKRDNERANMLAYLAAYTPEAPEFPQPLPSAEESVEEAELVETAEAVVEADGEEAAPAEEPASDI